MPLVDCDDVMIYILPFQSALVNTDAADCPHLGCCTAPIPRFGAEDLHGEGSERDEIQGN